VAEKLNVLCNIRNLDMPDAAILVDGNWSIPPLSEQRLSNLLFSLLVLIVNVAF